MCTKDGQSVTPDLSSVYSVEWTDTIGLLVPTWMISCQLWWTAWAMAEKEWGQKTTYPLHFCLFPFSYFMSACSSIFLRVHLSQFCPFEMLLHPCLPACGGVMLGSIGGTARTGKGAIVVLFGRVVSRRTASHSSPLNTLISCGLHGKTRSFFSLLSSRHYGVSECYRAAHLRRHKRRELVPSVCRHNSTQGSGIAT